MPSKAIVVYKSNYGSTKRYAEWIAGDIGAELKKAGEVKPVSLASYDTVIYGGPLVAVGIAGVKMITNNIEMFKEKKIIVFSVGIAPANEKTMKEVENKNFPGSLSGRIKHFHLRGAFDYNKLNFTHRMMMNILRRMLKGKKELSAEEKGMLAIYETPVDFVDKNSIKPIVDYIKGGASL